MKKVLLRMYLRKNLGDDLFLKIITDRYPNSQFYAITNRKEYKNIINKDNLEVVSNGFYRVLNYIGYKINIDNLKTTNIIKKKIDYDVLLGGSMFIENENIDFNKYSNRIKKSYLNSNKPYYILGSNFGPYKTKKYYDLYNNIFDKAEDVCFRESNSRELFKKIDKVRYNSDIVFSLDCTNIENENKDYVVISVINLENRKKLKKHKEKYIKLILELSKQFINKGKNIKLMSFCKYEGDEEAIEEIYNRFPENLKGNVAKYYYDGNIEESLNIISHCETIIATRFHATILGILFNKKVLPLIYSNKTLNILNDIKFKGEIIHLNNIPKTIDITKIKKYRGNLEFLKESANKQFEKLDEVLK